MANPETRHEAAASDLACQRDGAQGGDIPQEAGGTEAEAATAPVEATGMRDGRESPRIPLESGESARIATWSRAGAPAGALVFPVTAPRKKGRRGLLGHLRGSISENTPKIDVPVNLRPWTWEILPHVRETRDGSPLTRILDRIAWFTTLPDARYVLHAERLRQRKESLVPWALARFAAAITRKPSGPPPWIAGNSPGDDPWVHLR